MTRSQSIKYPLKKSWDKVFGMLKKTVNLHTLKTKEIPFEGEKVLYMVYDLLNIFIFCI